MLVTAHVSIKIVLSDMTPLTLIVHYTHIVLQIREQASNGGVRLPGRHTLVTGDKDISTGFDLTSIVKRGHFIRIQQHWFRVRGTHTSFTAYSSCHTVINQCVITCDVCTPLIASTAQCAMLHTHVAGRSCSIVTHTNSYACMHCLHSLLSLLPTSRWSQWQQLHCG
jgi:hypothetical protein